jgi:hypothetical protein
MKPRVGGTAYVKLDAAQEPVPSLREVWHKSAVVELAASRCILVVPIGKARAPESVSGDVTAGVVGIHVMGIGSKTAERIRRCRARPGGEGCYEGDLQMPQKLTASEDAEDDRDLNVRAGLEDAKVSEAER